VVDLRVVAMKSTQLTRNLQVKASRLARKLPSKHDINRHQVKIVSRDFNLCLHWIAYLRPYPFGSEDGIRMIKKKVKPGHF